MNKSFNISTGFEVFGRCAKSRNEPKDEVFGKPSVRANGSVDQIIRITHKGLEKIIGPCQVGDAVYIQLAHRRADCMARVVLSLDPGGGFRKSVISRNGLYVAFHKPPVVFNVSTNDYVCSFEENWAVFNYTPVDAS